MAKSEFVLNIGDDNVVLTRFTNGKVANAWLGSPDPAMATEELSEAFAQDSKARISVLFDTLDQSFKDEEMPRVGILDRRKILARHINMAFPGANLRGARLVAQTDKKTLQYEMASVPLDGRVPGWLDFVQSLPNEKGGLHTIAAENVDMIAALAAKDIPVEEGKNHWRHLIGVNVTGGLRQIIEKNGRLSLTRLTQAPPPETPPDEFADMIIRDFKATITYIRRLGYQVGEPLDLVVLTTAENKRVLENMDWEGARSVSVYTPYEAGVVLNLGSLGREDQAYSDVLHAAWFAAKKKPLLPLTRAAALGDTKDDIRELAFAGAPYAAGLLVAGFVAWSGWTGYEFYEVEGRNDILRMQLNAAQSELARARESQNALPYTASQVRNVIEVDNTLDVGKVDVVPTLQKIGDALQSDAYVLNLQFTKSSRRDAAGNPAPVYAVDLSTRLSSDIRTGDEAIQTARAVESKLTAQFGTSYKVTMTTSPISAQASKDLSGGMEEVEANSQAALPEAFYAAYRIEAAQP